MSITESESRERPAIGLMSALISALGQQRSSLSIRVGVYERTQPPAPGWFLNMGGLDGLP
eukprot:406875-Prymnesium_polylepis.2